MSELKQLCQCHYKIILLGEPGVGMTSFALRVKYGMFMPTNCRDNVRDAAVIMFKMKVDGDEVTVRCEEPAGIERHRSISRSFFRNADAIILMYSVSDKYTFDGLTILAKSAKQDFASTGLVWALFGNKCDKLIDIDDLDKKVSALSARVLGDESLSKLHFFVSAKTGEGVVESLASVVKEIHRRSMEEPKNGMTGMEEPKNRGMTVTDETSTSTHKCCAS